MGKMMNRLKKSLSTTNQKESENEVELLTTILQKTILKVKNELGNSTDLIIREFIVHNGKRAALFYTDGLTDSIIVQEIVESLIFTNEKANNDHIQEDCDLLDYYQNHYAAIGEVKSVNDFKTLYHFVLSGDSVFIIDGIEKGMSFGTKGWDKRSVEEPSTQTIIRGPKESFTESLRTNTALIRRKIKSECLWMETQEIGTQTKTAVALMYMNGIVNPKIVDEIRERLNRINVDGIFDSGNIEELISDAPYSPFPTIFNTERPDSVAASLLEGKVAIIVDGTPFVLLAPAIFIQFFQASEDYYHHFYIATFVRIIRAICFSISLLLLALYIAIVTFHQEMLPTPLLNSISSQREGVPFPAFIEALFLMGSFEILREAGVRMPRVIGSATSIVGGLVLGQASVDAGLVSASMVIIVALIALSDFVIPSIAMANPIKLMRYFLVFLAATFGMYGMAIGTLGIVLHLCSLRSFGIPYMEPITPLILFEQKDVIIRFPQWAQALRPKFFSEKNPVREKMTAPTPPNSNSKK